MKTLNSIKNYGLALVAMTLMLTAVNAQARYKHVPRVKVDTQKTEKSALPQEKAANTIAAAFINVEENTPVATETVANIENTTVASTTEDVVTVNNKTKSVVKHHKVVKNNKKVHSDGFTKNVKKNSKVMEVKDVKKSALARWILYMIICLAAALLFTILAAALAYTLYVSGAYALITIF